MIALKGCLRLAVLAVGAVLPCYGQAVEAPAKKAVEVKPAVEATKPGADAAEKKPVITPPAKPVAPRILGWKEWVWIVKPELVLRAKLDTGARTCSIHATNIEALELDGKKWVKFTISDPNSEKGARFRHKAPVLRVAKVKNDTGGLDERYVVPLTFQIGGDKMEAEFSLNDRDGMLCPVLIGRNLLKTLGAVDAGRKDLLEKPKKPASNKVKKKTPSSK